MFKLNTRMLCLGVATLALVGSAAVTGSTRPLTEKGSMGPTAAVTVAPTSAPIPQPSAAPSPAPQPQRQTATEQTTIDKAASLQSKLRAADRRHTAIARQIKSLESARATLKARMENYRQGTIAHLSAQLREAEALHNIFKARLSQSGDALERQQRLKSKGYASQANFDSASASSVIAQNDVAASAARIERIRVELNSAKKGVFIGEGRDDVPYSQQRDDEIMLRLVDLNAQAQSTQMAINDLAQQVALAGGRPVTVAGAIRTTTSIATIAWDTARKTETALQPEETSLHQPD